MDTGFESMCAQAVGTKQLRGVDGHNAERAAAVRNDFFAARKFGKTTLQFLKRDGERAGDVCGPIFFPGPDIDHHYFSRTHAFHQRVAIYRMEIPAVMQESGANLLQLREPILTQDPQDTEEVTDQSVRDRIHHETPMLSRQHQAGSVEDLQVLRSVGNTHAGFFGQNFYRALGLAEQVEQLQALGARESFADAGQLAVGVVLEGALGGF